MAKKANSKHRFQKQLKSQNNPTEFTKTIIKDKPSYFSFRRIMLVMFGVLLLFGLFKVPRYNKWYVNKVWKFYSQIKEQSKFLSYDERRQIRYGKSWVISQNIKKYLDENKVENPILLMPPKKYLELNKDKYDWGEALSFYYHTGIKALNINSDSLQLATHGLITNNENIQLITIKDKNTLEQLLIEYKKVPIAKGQSK